MLNVQSICRSFRHLSPAVVCLLLSAAANGQTAATDKGFFRQAAGSTNQGKVLVEKWIWREIDLRQTMDLPVALPDQHLIQYLLDAAYAREMRVLRPYALQIAAPSFYYEPAPGRYASQDTLPIAELDAQIVRRDSFNLFDETGDFIPDNPLTPEVEGFNVVVKKWTPEEMQRFLIEEVWYYDLETGQKGRRIEGVMPLYEVVDPVRKTVVGAHNLFWISYPDLQKYLARHERPDPKREKLTWAQWFELGLFSGKIVREGHIHVHRRRE
jgi:hypothetical protein